MSRKAILAAEKKSRTLSAPAVERARGFRIVDDTTFEAGAGLLRELVAIRKAIDDLFDPVVRAAYAAHKAATSQRGVVRDPVDEAEKRIRLELGKYAESQQRAREEAARIALEAEEQVLALGEGAGLPAASSSPPAGLPTAEGLGFRDAWLFEVENLDALPREYLMPDEAKIERAVRRLGGATNIPGVRVFSRKVPVQR
jgi:hypothetical protein